MHNDQRHYTRLSSEICTTIRYSHSYAYPPRRLTLRSALALSVMNMVGAGPFITQPLVAMALSLLLGLDSSPGVVRRR